jgi:dihydrolipoamide dehydrogenase
MKYDTLFIGAGPAGYVAALAAAKLGQKVVICEKGGLGGTCLNVGCIPSKALLHASEVIHAAEKEGPNFGYQVQGKLNFTELMAFKNRAIFKFQKGIEYLLKKNKITIVRGEAHFINSSQVEVGGQIIDSDKIVIASGSSVTGLPFLPIDEKTILSSTGALNLKEKPDSMIVIGGGVIGLELGSVYARLGTKVTVIEAQDRILPEFDTQISKTFLTILKKQGIEVHLNARVQEAHALTDQTQGFNLTLDTNGVASHLEAQKILVSIGRSPNTTSLKLDSAGVKIDERGFVITNQRFETSSKNIYAIGDCCSNPMLAHKGSHEGVALAHALSGHNEKINYAAIPNVVYTHPEIASVGFSEQELDQKGIDYKKQSFPIQANSRYGAIGGVDPGFTKILITPDASKLLGMHIISPAAGEMIMEGVLAMNESLPIEALKRAIHPHPTFCESIHEALSNLHT